MEDLFSQLRTVQGALDACLAPGEEGSATALDALGEEVLQAVADRLQDNFPYGQPLYAGQMLKPPHPIARAAYMLAMSVNPNNHALDGGRASSRMEMEAVAALSRMFGFREHLGHLSSGGTFANLEALWVAGRLTRRAKGVYSAVAASDQAHYTHSRVSEVLGLPFVTVASNDRGQMDMSALESVLKAGTVGTVVATLGTTAVGAVDPLHEIMSLRQRYGFRVHVDAAYGGYFALASNLEPAARAAFDVIPKADSIVVDPHKHGLQPYGCGSILFSDPAVGRLYKHESPYTYFSSKELHLGEISLECSRAGAAAAALWATQRLLPYERGGPFARGLEEGRQAALALHARLQTDGRFVVPRSRPELDIVYWALRGTSFEESSGRAQEVFDSAARVGLHLALVTLPARFFPDGSWPLSAADAAGGKSLTCLRSVLMKPEHLRWMEEIWRRLCTAMTLL